VSDAAFALAFYACAGLAVVPAVAILLSSEIVRQAFWLLGTLTGVAGLYLLLGADFLGLTQVLVYIGGILILMLFGVMLTQRAKGTYGQAPTTRAWPAGLIGIGATLMLALAAVAATAGSGRLAPTLPATTGTTRGIGEALMSGYILPFEMVSIVLLAALVGAAFLARRSTEVAAPPSLTAGAATAGPATPPAPAGPAGGQP